MFVSRRHHVIIISCQVMSWRGVAWHGMAWHGLSSLAHVLLVFTASLTEEAHANRVMCAVVKVLDEMEEEGK
jgi:predicted ferric reductase